ncbi:hypothetical protein Scep_026276 [Stephania cephalantha]|uniref:Uncharacterized protein n=1 Tax=Stephania cephalantha TaxID=152367 RepID=A0AAP0EN12_9MAGN
MFYLMKVPAVSVSLVITFLECDLSNHISLSLRRLSSSCHFLSNVDEGPEA